MKAKVQLELSLSSAVKDSKKSFYEYIKRKRIKVNVQPLLDVRENVVMEDEDKTELLNSLYIFCLH